MPGRGSGRGGWKHWQTDERVAVVFHVDGGVDEDSVLHAALARRGHLGLEVSSVVPDGVASSFCIVYR